MENERKYTNRSRTSGEVGTPRQITRAALSCEFAKQKFSLSEAKQKLLLWRISLAGNEIKQKYHNLRIK